MSEKVPRIVGLENPIVGSQEGRRGNEAVVGDDHELLDGSLTAKGRNVIVQRMKRIKAGERTCPPRGEKATGSSRKW